MAQPLRIDELNEKLRASGRIEGQHAMQLRRIIYANGSVGHESAKLLLGLDRACSKKDPALGGGGAVAVAQQSNQVCGYDGSKLRRVTAPRINIACGSRQNPFATVSARSSNCITRPSA